MEYKEDNPTSNETSLFVESFLVVVFF